MNNITHGARPGKDTFKSEAATAFSLTTVKAEPRVDSRMLAVNMHTQHRTTTALIDRYKPELTAFGKVLFQIAPLPNSKTGQKERFALLNEDQAFYLVALSRNSPRVVELKGRLVKAFGEARRAASQHSTEYLPTYHQLHDEIHALAAGSAHERHVHMNINKLVNKTVGIDSGQRSTAPVPKQALMIVAQTMAAKAMHSASNHHEGYRRVKQSMLALTAVTMLETA